MNLYRRAKFIASGALALGALAGLTIAASPAHAATSAASFPSGIHYTLPLDPYQVHVSDGSGCTSNTLTAYGWNFYNGEKLSVNFYRDGQKIKDDPFPVTASQAGLLGGYFAVTISYPLQDAGGGAFAANVTEPDGFTWWAPEQIVC
jgi:hypothetical protein